MYIYMYRVYLFLTHPLFKTSCRCQCNSYIGGSPNHSPVSQPPNKYHRQWSPKREHNFHNCFFTADSELSVLKRSKRASRMAKIVDPILRILSDVPPGSPANSGGFPFRDHHGSCYGPLILASPLSNLLVACYYLEPKSM